MYHFCQDALHLRDWLANDPTTGMTKQNGELLFNTTSPALGACRDVANGSKHLNLTGQSSISGERTGHAEVTGQGVTIGVPAMGSTGGWIQYHWTVEGDWNAMDLATEAAADWDKWLDSQGLR